MELGLSRYEAIMLSSLIEAEKPMKADEISRMTGIPRTKVYQVGRSLEDKGLIRIVGYRPTLFIGPPRDKLTSLLLNHVIEEFGRKVSLVGAIKPFKLPIYLIGKDKVVPVFGSIIKYIFESIAGRVKKALFIVNEDLVESFLRHYRGEAGWEVMFTSIRAAIKAKDLLEELRICNSPFSGVIGDKEGLIIYSEGKGIYTTDGDLLKSMKATFYIVRTMSFTIGQG